MYEIKAEGMSYLYFTKAKGLASEILNESSLDADALTVLWNERLIYNIAELRLVFVRSAIIPNRRALYFLQWNDGTDLEELDRKVETNEYNDDNFANSVLTNFGKLHCVKNHDWEGYSLVVRTADAYLSHPDLEVKSSN